MSEVVPLASSHSNGVHISELIRTAADANEIVTRLIGKTAPRQDADNKAGNEAVSVDDDVATVANLLDSIDSDGRTAFHWCLALRRFDLAHQLAAKGAAVATIDLDNTSTLTSACSVEAPIEILELITKGVYNGAVSLWNAADTAGNTPLLYLASRGNIKGLKFALSQIPADVVLRFRPIERAEAEKRRFQNEFLAKQGDSSLAPPQVTELPDDTATCSTAVDESSVTYSDLFHQNKRLQTALHRAVSKGSAEFVEELLSFVKRRSASTDSATLRNFINCPDSQGNTVLHYASMENNEDMGRFLIRNGASRDAKNKKGQEFWQL